MITHIFELLMLLEIKFSNTFTEFILTFVDHTILTWQILYTKPRFWHCIFVYQIYTLDPELIIAKCRSTISHILNFLVEKDNF